MADEQLAEIRARRNAITPGKWVISLMPNRIVTTDEGMIEEWDDGEIATFMSDDDAAFIVNAPTDVDTLLAKVEQLQVELQQANNGTNIVIDTGYSLIADRSLLREQLAAAEARAKAAEAERDDLRTVINYIDKKAPRADWTCVIPGLTLSQAARRMMVEEAAEKDVEP